MSPKIKPRDRRLSFRNDGRMNIMMKNVAFASIEDINKFLLGNDEREFCVPKRENKYSFITETLVSLRYNTLRKKDKNSVKKCLQKITGYEDRQMKRLIKEWKKRKKKFLKTLKVNKKTPSLQKAFQGTFEDWL